MTHYPRDINAARKGGSCVKKSTWEGKKINLVGHFCLFATTSKALAMASDLDAMAFLLMAPTSKALAMASDLDAMAFLLMAITSKALAMASDLDAIEFLLVSTTSKALRLT